MEEYVFLVFAAAFGIMIAIAVKGIAAWNKNSHSPCLTVMAKIVSKRKTVSHHSHANAGDPTGAHGYTEASLIHFYVTFQAESGGSMEFTVTGSEYKRLAEGDRGKLSFQGTRYVSFEKTNHFL